MRTRMAISSGQHSAPSAAWASIAEATASPARAKAAASPSPPVANTKPPWASTALRTIPSWRANAKRMDSGAASHRRVDASTSVNKNVTVPDGRAT